MSIDFIALFDVVSKDASLEWLREKLSVNPPALAEVGERYRDYWIPKAWAIEPAPHPGRPMLPGPGGFAIFLDPGTLKLYHMMRFNDFTGDPSFRGALRRVCMFVADLVGSPRAIYTHELMPHDGQGLDQIEAGLRAKIGPPATTFEELHAARDFGPRAWYVDTFADLRNEQGKGR